MSIFCLSGSTLLAPQASGGDPRIRKELIDWRGQQRSFHVYAPPTPGACAQRPPLLVLLHGAGGDGMTLAARWKSLARREGFVLLAPDAADRSGWNVPTDGPELLYRLVESLRRRYDIDAGRVYLFGHSAGAVFALYMSLLEPEYFAAAAVHAGALGSEGDPRTVRLARRRIPIAICSGTEDPIFPMTAVRSTVEQLQQSGMPVVVRWMPRHGHEYESRADDINLWAWRFLHEHKLPETPRYTPYEFE